jgi:hypothetical protein
MKILPQTQFKLGYKMTLVRPPDVAIYRSYRCRYCHNFPILDFLRNPFRKAQTFSIYTGRLGLHISQKKTLGFEKENEI